MRRADICNVEPVSVEELRATLKGLGFEEENERWTLTVEGLTFV